MTYLKPGCLMLLACALLPTTPTVAQSANTNTYNYKLETEFSNPLQSRFVQMAFGRSHAKKTAATKPVIWAINLNPQYGYNDSLRYYYSGGRGSAFNHHSLTYDDFEYTPPNYRNDGYLHADSAKYLDQKLWYKRGYNAANKVTTHEETDKIRILAYNSSNLLSEVTEIAKLSTPDSIRRWVFSYNSSGQVIFDSMFIKRVESKKWEVEQTIAYTYDASGRLSGVHQKNTFANGQQLHQILYAGNSTLPQTYIVSDLNHATSTFEDVHKYEYEYKNGTIILARTNMWNKATQSWTNAYEMHHHQNAAGLTDSIMIFKNGSADQYLLITYNSDNNPTSKTRFMVGDTSYLSKVIWRYEEDSDTAVVTKPETKSQLDIYPNPATDKLFLADERSGTYQIYSDAGRLVQSGRIDRGAAIPIHALRPGLYVLHVQVDEGGNVKTSFLRQ